MTNDPLFDVSGQLVLVSGGSRGIGLALAEGFVQRGARVVITGREEATLKAAAAAISTETNKAAFKVCDIANDEHVLRLAKEVQAEFGPVDTLLNVAGINIRKRTETYEMAEWDRILNINLRGLFLLTQQVGIGMLERGRGCVINIDSLNTAGPLRGVTPYAVSKAGVSMLTRSLAQEWGPRGIRVNALAPGFILTDLTRKLWSIPTMQAWMKVNTPLQRLGEVGDLVGTAIFLASPASAFMTGQVVYVDGGVSAGVNWPIELP
jgi:NAD(P)-dependent dehydrogenase (short-subunit alcohol dehydrogenase family)